MHKKYYFISRVFLFCFRNTFLKRLPINSFIFPFNIQASFLTWRFSKMVHSNLFQTMMVLWSYLGIKYSLWNLADVHKQRRFSWLNFSVFTAFINDTVTFYTVCFFLVFVIMCHKNLRWCFFIKLKEMVYGWNRINLIQILKSWPP